MPVTPASRTPDEAKAAQPAAPAMGLDGEAKSAPAVTPASAPATPQSNPGQASGPASTPVRARVMPKPLNPARELGVEFPTDPNVVLPGYSPEDQKRLMQTVNCLVAVTTEILVRDSNRQFNRIKVVRDERVLAPRWWALLQYPNLHIVEA